MLNTLFILGKLPNSNKIDFYNCLSYLKLKKKNGLKKNIYASEERDETSEIFSLLYDSL